jgi:hypothetical protein
MAGTSSATTKEAAYLPCTNKRQIDPGDAGCTIRLLTRFRAQVQDRKQGLHFCELNRLLGRYLEHASSHGDGPMADLHDDSAARLDQSGKVRHGQTALLLIEMHPDCAEHDEVEPLPARPQQGQIGRLSFSHSICGDECSAFAGMRIASVGSTATTR